MASFKFIAIILGSSGKSKHFKGFHSVPLLVRYNRCFGLPIRVERLVVFSPWLNEASQNLVKSPMPLSNRK